ncbi:MAG: calcium-translocating P-type ATPase, PMCA-type [bacterium]|nr:calcium-translocating P-type ATPase, PMCA-type [bacterium]
MEKGLTSKEVEESRKKYGSNNISISNNNKFINILLSSLSDPIIKILLIALAIKIVFLFKDFDFFETLGIVIAIFVASFISSMSEYGSGKAFERLQQEASKINCKVVRDSSNKEINIDEVVVGDIIRLETGDKIPADGYLISGDITVDESSLNGETKEIYKESISNWRNSISDINKVYRGTVVYSNSALMKVTSVGDNTMYGKIASELKETQRESPLKIRLTNLAKIISKIGYIASFLVSFSYLFSKIVISNNFDIELIMKTITNFPVITSYILYALTLSVTIIVVAVPEGLPMMITLVLSSNMKRMLKNNVLVRKLTGIETAGSLNILFTDKTGTLTKGSLEVIGLINGNYKEYSNELELEKYKKYHDIVKKSIIYNNASSYSNDKSKIIGGNITDKALLRFIISDTSKTLKTYNLIPFSSKTKYSAITLDDKNKINLIKGSPDLILKNCNKFYDEFGFARTFIDKEQYISKINSYSKKGIRLIALATSLSKSIMIRDLTLVGVILIKDEVRSEAIEGVKLVKNAHIQTVMITGDNIDTAISIAKEVGIIENDNDIALTSDELNSKSDEELKKLLPRLKVVARSLPQDKSRLVRISQELNLVVGMTGDGVNDAPALKKADVGFAMGSGTEVSKEASDIVILDDNFISISKAILFGRTIFKSIRKFIIVQLTINFCAISLSIICPFIGVDTPVTVIQMLWVNMVMDTLAGLAFAYEPPLIEYMNELPKKRDESIINRYMISEIVFTGIYSALLCLAFLKLPIISNYFRNSVDKVYLMTAFFGLFIFIDIFNSFNARTTRLDIFSNITSNKVFILIMLFITIVQILLIYFGGSMFRTAGLTFSEFLIMLLIALTVVPVDWIRKIIYRRKYGLGGV